MAASLSAAFGLAGCVGIETIGNATDAASRPRFTVGAGEARWRETFVRGCGDAQPTPLVIAEARGVVSFCEAAFDLRSGRFVGRVRPELVAVLPGPPNADAGGEDFDRGGFWRGPLVLEPLAPAPRAFELDELEGLAAVAAKGDRALVVRDAADDDAAGMTDATIAGARGERAVVLALPSLEVLASAPLPHASGLSTYAFLPDGTATVLTDAECVTTRGDCPQWEHCDTVACARRAVFRVGARALEPLGDAFEGVDSVAFAAAAPRAVLTRTNGARELVDVPSGARLASLPAGQRAPETDADVRAGAGPHAEHVRERDVAAIDARGGRVAFSTADGLAIADVSTPGSPKILHVAPGLVVDELAFAAGGRALFAGRRGDALHAFRDDGPAVAAPPSPAYEPEAPQSSAALGEAGDARAASFAPRVLASYADDRGATVLASATDAAEFGPPGGELEAWAKLLLAREGAWSTPPTARTWRDERGRHAEYEYFPETGCAVRDHYVRFAERGAWLYRVELTVAPGAAAEVVTPLATAFFDRPLGPPARGRAWPKRQALLKGPC